MRSSKPREGWKDEGAELGSSAQHVAWVLRFAQNDRLSRIYGRQLGMARG